MAKPLASPTLNKQEANIFSCMSQVSYSSTNSNEDDDQPPMSALKLPAVKTKTKEESPVEVVRREAKEKKRNRQDRQAVAMKKHRDEAVVKKQAKVGDIVLLKLDPRDVTKPQALLAIVFDTAKDGAGGCMVVTVHGVVCQQPGCKRYYIPCDKYKVLDPGCAIPTALLKIKESVLAGEFVGKTQKKVTLSQSYFSEYGRSTCAKKKCKCKGLCSKNCGCVKLNQKCHSGCGCGGKCNNPKNGRY